ncbi:MAG: rod shape-determining protein MreC [Lachnospiraceae bacterium]|nr:rod shape-determining protein MreC [Lachnospiraceae bacterium]
MRRRKRDSIPSKYILSVIGVLCVGFMLLSYVFGFQGGPLRTVSGYLFVPIQKGINYVGWYLSDRADNLQDLRMVMAERDALQEQVDQLTIENSQLMQEKYELEDLRALYALDRSYSNYSKIAANVIGKDPGNWFSSFQIDKGYNDGIEVDMNVLSGSGLVGIVTKVGSDWAQVRSIIDDTSNVSAMILTTADNCMVSGNLQLMSEGYISISQLKDSDDQVEYGAKVVTSQVSDKYHPGLLIGYVQKLDMDSNNLTKSGTITPAVDFEHLRSVLVITDKKRQIDPGDVL